jgi:hypothetical protein
MCGTYDISRQGGEPMITLNWKSINTFKQHMEEMDSFRHTHAHLVPENPVNHRRTTYTPLPGNPPCPARTANGFKDADGKNIVVPIWSIGIPKDSQN